MLVGQGYSLVEAKLPQYFEISFGFYAPALGDEKSIFSLESDTTGLVMALYSATGTGSPLQFWYLGSPMNGPLLRADYESRWTDILIRYTAGMITIESGADVVMFPTITFGTLPTAPWNAMLYFSDSVSESAGGYVRQVRISGVYFGRP
jgi:hypothetical protein